MYCKQITISSLYFFTHYMRIHYNIVSALYQTIFYPIIRYTYRIRKTWKSVFKFQQRVYLNYDLFKMYNIMFVFLFFAKFPKTYILAPYVLVFLLKLFDMVRIKKKRLEYELCSRHFSDKINTQYLRLREIKMIIKILIIIIIFRMIIL